MSLPPPRKRTLPPPKKKALPFHIQHEMFLEEQKSESKYTSKIKAPIYEPKNRKPNIIELVNTSKAKKLIEKIINSGLPKEEQTFLIEAAYRHNVFNYHLCADYYAHASAKMQALMEESALVIIDFDKAIENGYVSFHKEIEKLFVEEHEKSK